MENPMLHTLEQKVEIAIHKMNLLKTQIEEVHARNIQLQTENMSLKSRQKDWEQKLSSVLKKLECFERVDSDNHENSETDQEEYEVSRDEIHELEAV